jgi:hypothetical protein
MFRESEALQNSTVIPGRAEGANPESIFPGGAARIATLRSMDSGPRFARPE